jgi:RecJ-like exonuclease
MGWKTLKQRIWPAMKKSETISPRLYLGSVALANGITFGITNMCRHCRGTGLRKGSKVAPCPTCTGKGYVTPTDTCMHVCGCDRPVDSGLVFVCVSCFNEECDYPMSAQIVW